MCGCSGYCGCGVREPGIDKLVAVLVAAGSVCELRDVVVPSDMITLSWSASAAVKTKAHRVRVGDQRQHLVVTRARGYFVLWSEISLINIDCCIALF